MEMNQVEIIGTFKVGIWQRTEWWGWGDKKSQPRPRLRLALPTQASRADVGMRGIHQMATIRKTEEYILVSICSQEIRVPLQITGRSDSSTRLYPFRVFI